MPKRFEASSVVFRAPVLALAASIGAFVAVQSGCEPESPAGAGPSHSDATPAASCADAPDPAAHAGAVQSVSRIAFGPSDVLFVADWKASKVHAFTLPPAASQDDSRSFNIKNLETALRDVVGCGDLVLEDVAARPGSNEVYAAVSIGESKTPAIVKATADGALRVVDLKSAPQSSATLEKAPDEKLTFWNTIPGRSFTVTDMKWHEGKLYVAGLSNQAFASTLRVLDYPFGGTNAMTTVEMYHTVHNQIETRAPIRAMRFMQLGGKPHLVAAYLCTPVVTIPVDELADGAHVRAKTIGELADGGIPINIIPYTGVNFMTGEPVDYVLVANLYRQSSVIPLRSLEEANAKPGMSTPVPLDTVAGVEAFGAPMGNVYRIADQNAKFFIVLRRDLKTGQSELVSINKMMNIRLSDYEVSEYLFPDYQFGEDQMRGLQSQNMMKQDEGYPNLVRQP